MTVSLDTLTRNVCGPKSFQMPIWVGDLYFKDSVYGFTMTVYWDRAHFDLDGNDVVANSSTIVQ
jgi:hypothetical protein